MRKLNVIDYCKSLQDRVYGSGTILSFNNYNQLFLSSSIKNSKNCMRSKLNKYQQQVRVQHDSREPDVCNGAIRFGVRMSRFVLHFHVCFWSASHISPQDLNPWYYSLKPTLLTSRPLQFESFLLDTWAWDMEWWWSEVTQNM